VDGVDITGEESLDTLSDFQIQPQQMDIMSMPVILTAARLVRVLPQRILLELFAVQTKLPFDWYLVLLEDVWKSTTKEAGVQCVTTTQILIQASQMSFVDIWVSLRVVRTRLVVEQELFGWMM